MSRDIVIQICLGSSCFSRGNKDLVKLIKEWLKKNHLQERVSFRGARCLDSCSEGPVIMINDTMIKNVTDSNIEQILEKHLGSTR